MRKKSESLSLTTIVIAAIVLVVLVVLIAIFTGRINVFGKSYTETSESAKKRVCLSIGGQCSSTNLCSDGNRQSGEFIDCGEGLACCK